MKRIELIDLLCQDELDSPYPIEALYDLEGLSYVELIGLLRAHRKGEPSRSFTRGGARRRIAERLGADEEEAKVLAQKAGPALEQVSRIATQHGVDLGRVGLAERVERVEERLAHLEARADSVPWDPAE